MSFQDLELLPAVKAVMYFPLLPLSTFHRSSDSSLAQMLARSLRKGIHLRAGFHYTALAIGWMLPRSIAPPVNKPGTFNDCLRAQQQYNGKPF